MAWTRLGSRRHETSEAVKNFISTAWRHRIVGSVALSPGPRRLLDASPVAAWKAESVVRPSSVNSAKALAPS